MADYQHILIAADFSNLNKQVLERAQEVAQRYQSKLSICHIIEDFPIADFAYDPMISIDMAMRDTMQKSAEKYIADVANTLSIPAENQWVEFGNPGHDVVRLAQENNADLIIIGSHGRHGIKLLLGSTANAVLHHAQCDVLAVRLSE
ncbi:MAG: universal stress protein [Methylophaga sp.]|nr:universal stress protein [Methylophaga sp.]